MTRLENLLKEMISEEGALCFTGREMAERRLRYINDLARKALDIVRDAGPKQEIGDVHKLIEMAKSGSLPEGFNQWLVKDHETGMTIAHIAAQYGTLPKSFDQWDIEDEYTDPVAITAAKFGHLPEGFDKWDLANEEGETVRDYAEAFAKDQAEKKRGPKM